jgi:hypothetical protein
MDAVWKNISIDNYLSSATGEENRITTVWKWEPKFYSDTKARKCIIDSANEWHSTYMSDSFVPRYKMGRAHRTPMLKFLPYQNIIQMQQLRKKARERMR